MNLWISGENLSADDLIVDRWNLGGDLLLRRSTLFAAGQAGGLHSFTEDHCPTHGLSTGTTSFSAYELPQ